MRKAAANLYGWKACHAKIAPRQCCLGISKQSELLHTPHPSVFQGFSSLFAIPHSWFILLPHTLFITVERLILTLCILKETLITTCQFHFFLVSSVIKFLEECISKRCICILTIHSNFIPIWLLVLVDLIEQQKLSLLVASTCMILLKTFTPVFRICSSTWYMAVFFLKIFCCTGAVHLYSSCFCSFLASICLPAL